MIIQIDTREKPDKIKHLTDYFDKHSIQWHRSKNYIGDYISLENTGVIVERKTNVLEFAKNAGKKHDVFKRELQRLDSINGRMVIVIEENIGKLIELMFWKNKRSKMRGEVLYKICKAWKEKHNIDFIFCAKKDSPKIIFEILKGEKSDE